MIEWLIYMKDSNGNSRVVTEDISLNAKSNDFRRRLSSATSVADQWKYFEVIATGQLEYHKTGLSQDDLRDAWTRGGKFCSHQRLEAFYGSSKEFFGCLLFKLRPPTASKLPVSECAFRAEERLRLSKASGIVSTACGIILPCLGLLNPFVGAAFGIFGFAVGIGGHYYIPSSMKKQLLNKFKELSADDQTESMRQIHELCIGRPNDCFEREFSDQLLNDLSMLRLK